MKRKRREISKREKYIREKTKKEEDRRREGEGGRRRRGGRRREGGRRKEARGRRRKETLVYGNTATRSYVPGQHTGGAYCGAQRMRQTVCSMTNNRP